MLSKYSILHSVVNDGKEKHPKIDFIFNKIKSCFRYVYGKNYLEEYQNFKLSIIKNNIFNIVEPVDYLSTDTLKYNTGDGTLYFDKIDDNQALEILNTRKIPKHLFFFEEYNTRSSFVEYKKELNNSRENFIISLSSNNRWLSGRIFITSNKCISFFINENNCWYAKNYNNKKSFKISYLYNKKEELKRITTTLSVIKKDKGGKKIGRLEIVNYRSKKTNSIKMKAFLYNSKMSGLKSVTSLYNDNTITNSLYKNYDKDFNDYIATFVKLTA